MKELLQITVASALFLAMVVPSSLAIEVMGDEEESRMLPFSIDLALFDGVGLSDDSRSILMQEAEAMLGWFRAARSWASRSSRASRSTSADRSSAVP